MNVCHQYFEKKQIFDSYATRINKGTYKALSRAKFFCKKYKYYLKLDIRKYFDSISHIILKTQLSALFKDEFLNLLLNKIIKTYTIKENRGLPIGNLTSQYFANHYLSSFDHYIKEKIKISGYVRYMDDMVFWSNDYNELKNISSNIFEFLENQLQLEIKYSEINTVKHGLNFLSYRVFDNRIELQQKSKSRFLKKITHYYRQLETNKWTQIIFARHLEPLLSFTKHASTDGFRKKIFDKNRE